MNFIQWNEDRGVLRLTLARPPLNILNIAMLEEISVALESYAASTDHCALLIDAQGTLFSAGVDVPEHESATVHEMITAVHRTLRLILRLPMPVIAAVQGGAYGGGLELALACDMILAADDAWFALPEITLGVFPPFAAAYLAAAVGQKTAAELILTGRKIGAGEAFRIGLVNHVYPAGSFCPQVEEFVSGFRDLSAFTLRQTKAACRAANLADVDRALAEIESIYLEGLMAGEDPHEGLTAFIEKRPPRWRHR